MRADQLIVQRKLAPTRSAAQRLIERKAVRYLGPKGWTVPSKAGEEVLEDCTMEVTDSSELRFVSRGGLKLEGALQHCNIDVTGNICLDAGQSTGGFTDALLQSGAARVVGIDVGKDQLHPSLVADSRVRYFEGVNARDVTGSEFAAFAQPHSFDFVTGDLSFISTTLVLPTLVSFLAPQGQLLLLIKPQFELQPEHIGKGGIVRKKVYFAEVETRIRTACRVAGLQVRGYFQSPITGGNGNTEFFVWAQPGQKL